MAATEIFALQYQVEPVERGKPGASWFMYHWPHGQGDSRIFWNAHPDRSTMTARKGDLMFHRERDGHLGQYRLLQVRVFRSSLCRAEGEYVWADTVQDAIARAGDG